MTKAIDVISRAGLRQCVALLFTLVPLQAGSLIVTYICGSMVTPTFYTMPKDAVESASG